VSSHERPHEFCARHGWSAEKYRKVAQRARARLSELLGTFEADVPTTGSSSDRQPGTYL
jgi:hypothetical protein